MFSRLALLASFLALAAAEYGCSSFAQLTHTSSGCPANQGNPDCSFIQANAAQFCSTTATSWEIINGPNCNLRGASYGCIYAAGLYSTTDQFCCPLIVTGGAPAPTVTATASSSTTATPTASATNTPSNSPTPTNIPAYYFNSLNDFNGVQGNNGWTYGFYTGNGYPNYNLATNYGYPNDGTIQEAWLYNPSCSGWVSNYEIMPNDGMNCNTPSCGSVKPRILWTNPYSVAFYMKIVVTLKALENCGNGVQMNVAVNGGTIWNNIVNYGMGTQRINYIGTYVNSVELTAQPNFGCSCAHMSYNIALIPVPATPSTTSTSSLTSSATTSARPTVTPSSSGTTSVTATVSPASTLSAPATLSPTPSASASGSASVTPSNTPSISFSNTVTTSAVSTAVVTETTSATGTVSASVSATGTVSATVSASVSATGSVSATVSATGTVSALPSPSTSISVVLMNTNYTNTTNITAASKTLDKGLTEGDKIGVGIGISITILLLVGCCYFACVYNRRSKETEKIDRRPSQVPTQAQVPTQTQTERRPSRRGSQLELRAIVAP